MFIKIAIPFFLSVFLGAGLSHAQQQRSFVSGGGDDTAPCSRAAPCRTFSVALSKTTAGGEIYALDPGSYGPVTINKAITIDGGRLGGVSVTAGTLNGIVVQATATDVVILRNLSINGSGVGVSGIRFLSGRALHIEGCNISSFTGRGIEISPTVLTAMSIYVTDTTSRANATGFSTTSLVGAAFVNVLIERSQFLSNTSGFMATDGTRATVRNSIFFGNSNGGIVAQSTSNQAVIDVLSSTVSNNGIGVNATGPLSAIRLSDLSIHANATGINFTSGAMIFSYGNNRIVGNTTNGPSGTPISPQ